MSAAFRGWPPAGLAFLEELEANNEREWFHAQRPRYEAGLAAPARALGEDLSDLGRPKLFRPFNDTRFHPGPPIKEHVGLAVGYEGAGGFYVELSLDGLFLAAGLHNPRPDQVDRLRRAVDDPRKASALRAALATAAAAGMAQGEPDLQRIPRGYAPDHPAADLLRYRRIVVARRDPVRKWMHGPGCGRRIRAALEASAPTVAWLREHVGPSEQPSRR